MSDLKAEMIWLKTTNGWDVPSPQKVTKNKQEIDYLRH